ncbi:MAG: TetR family transcriptional regulator, partial [Leucobacter sp.]|nr:TetR family transcriptional regulator [Leucobacter sp.]
MSSKVGRPRLASRQLLQEAAFELFQLGGYRATSVEQIAKTAGFSRATFFCLFTWKAELFWFETDEIVSGLQT